MSLVRKRRDKREEEEEEEAKEGVNRMEMDGKGKVGTGYTRIVWANRH